MAKKKHLVVVGTGASAEFGMPSVSAVRGIINVKAQESYPLAYSPCTNLYEHTVGNLGGTPASRHTG